MAAAPRGEAGRDEQERRTDEQRREPGLDDVREAHHRGGHEQREPEEREQRRRRERDRRRPDLHGPRPDARPDRVDLGLDRRADLVLRLPELLAGALGDRLGEAVEESAAFGTAVGRHGLLLGRRVCRQPSQAGASRSRTRAGSPWRELRDGAGGRAHGAGNDEARQAAPWRASCSGSDRRRSGDLSIFSRTLYQLSYRAVELPPTTMPATRTGISRATPTGLEPATSAVTGRRANQLRYGAS